MTNETQDPQIQRLFRQAADEIEVPADFGEHVGTGSKPIRHRSRYWAIGGAAAATVVGIVAIATIRPGNQEVPSAASPSPVSGLAETPAQVTTAPTSVEAAAPVAYVPGKPTSPAGLLVFPDGLDQTIHDAQQALISECMASAGFDYQPGPPPPTQPDRPDVWDEAYRRAHGYGFEPFVDIDDAAMDSFNKQQEDPAWRAAWSGSSAEGDGCTGAATQAVQEPYDEAANMASQQFAEASFAWTQTQIGDLSDEPIENYANPTLDHAVDAWAACMAEQGYAATDPTNLASDTRDNRPEGDWSFNNPPPSEVDIALDDWTCQQDTGFVDRFFGTLQASVEELAVQNSASIEQMNAATQATFDRASAVLERDPDSRES